MSLAVRLGGRLLLVAGSISQIQNESTTMAREIVVVHRREGKSRKSNLDHFEQIAKIASAIAIPIVLAIVGWFIQRQSVNNSLNQEYIKLAVSVLKEKEEPDQESLRAWAVQLLNQHSEVKFNDKVRADLASGKLAFPMITADGGFTTSLIGTPGQEGWCLLGIRTNGIWSEQYLRSLSNSASPTNQLADVPNLNEVITPSVPLNFRVSPKPDSSTMGLIPPGLPLRVIGSTVSADGQTWIHVALLVGGISRPHLAPPSNIRLIN